MRAGLIPSRALQERRIVHERNELNGELESDKGGIYLSFFLILVFFYIKKSQSTTILILCFLMVIFYFYNLLLACCFIH